MDVDPMEYVEGEDDRDGKGKRETAADRQKARLNTWVAITVALIATFMGICNVKDGNIVQAMQQDQAKSIDTWAWYQAKKTRIVVAENAIEQIELQELTASPNVKPALEKKIAEKKTYLAQENVDAKKKQAEAEGFDMDYDAWNVHDDQFDMSEALLSLAIALLATTSLTQKRWMYFVALAPTFFGGLYGLAGLLGWGLHSNLFAKLLGT